MWQLKQGDIDRLKNTQPPFLFLYEGDFNLLHEQIISTHVYKKYFELEGRRMTTPDGVFEEFRKKLNFPSYFGMNFNALNDCLNDIGVLEDDNFLLIVRDAEKLLDLHKEDLLILLEILNETAIQWAIPYYGNGKEWSHESIPFKIILQTSKAKNLEKFMRRRFRTFFWTGLNNIWNYSHDNL